MGVLPTSHQYSGKTNAQPSSVAISLGCFLQRYRLSFVIDYSSTKAYYPLRTALPARQSLTIPAYNLTPRFFRCGKTSTRRRSSRAYYYSPTYRVEWAAHLRADHLHLWLIDKALLNIPNLFPYRRFASTSETSSLRLNLRPETVSATAQREPEQLQKPYEEAARGSPLRSAVSSYIAILRRYVLPKSTSLV
jgi:hypothetical protein